MMPSNATPLSALDAVVLDTETTGLDTAKAQLIEIGAVRVTGGTIDESSVYHRLVRPPGPVPAAAVAVHGIDDAALRDAPAFATVERDLRGMIDGQLLIGHSIGFDLTVLGKEFLRAGVQWTPPRSLCIRMLAEVAEPTLPDYSLERLAAWLGVAPEGRHSAVGDAFITARVFIALLPKLQTRGIRTLAEAEAALRQLTHVLDAHHRAGWQAPVKSPHELGEFGESRVDLYPYRNRVEALMRTPIVVPADSRIADALARMMQERISSVLIGQALPQTAGTLGIVTERDVLRALAANGAEALSMPASAFASRPLHTVPADAFVYRAIGRMERLRVRHLAVTGADGTICGMISARDTLRQRAREAIWLGDEIDVADDVAALARAWAKVPDMAAALRREKVSGRETALLISQELCALTARAAHLAERAMAAAGEGEPPCAYAVAVLGSAGRGESLLALDQDNAVVFADDVADAQHWFAAFGVRLADILHEAGVPYCKGGVMASNAQWRGSIATWRRRVAGWIAATDPAALLSVDIFFDLRGVYGDLSLADTLWRDALDMAAGQTAFAKLMAEKEPAAPALGMFGRFVTQDGRVDLKRSALFGIVTTARVLAVQHHVAERATPARFEGVRALKIGNDHDLAELQDAHAALLDFLADQQIDDIAHGRPVTNAVVVNRLSARERDRLRSALAAVQNLDTLTRELLFR